MTRDPQQLTEGELFVLRLIQEAYGPENSEDQVFFTNNDEAAIFVKGEAGVGGLGFAVLTNLAEWLADGKIASVEELKRDWLMINDT